MKIVKKAFAKHLLRKPNTSQNLNSVHKQPPSHTQSQFKPHESSATTQNEPHKKHVKWFNDPFLLASHCESLILHSKHSLPPPSTLTEIRDLMSRHTGSATPVVYGRLINALAQRGLVSEVESYVNTMKSKGLKVTAQTYTLLIQMYSKKLVVCRTSNQETVDLVLKELWRVWESLVDCDCATVIHANAVIGACVMPVSLGNKYAVQIARRVYRHVLESGKQLQDGASDQMKPDVITFTHIFRVESSLVLFNAAKQQSPSTPSTKPSKHDQKIMQNQKQRQQLPESESIDESADPIATILARDFIESNVKIDDGLLLCLVIHLSKLQTNPHMQYNLVKLFLARAYNLPLQIQINPEAIPNHASKLADTFEKHVSGGVNLKIPSKTLDVLVRLMCARNDKHRVRQVVEAVIKSYGSVGLDGDGGGRVFDDVCMRGIVNAYCRTPEFLDAALTLIDEVYPGSLDKNGAVASLLVKDELKTCVYLAGVKSRHVNSLKTQQYITAVLESSRARVTQNIVYGWVQEENLAGLVYVWNVVNVLRVGGGMDGDAVGKEKVRVARICRDAILKRMETGNEIIGKFKWAVDKLLGACELALNKK